MLDGNLESCTRQRGKLYLGTDGWSQRSCTPVAEMMTVMNVVMMAMTVMIMTTTTVGPAHLERVRLELRQTIVG